MSAVTIMVPDEVAVLDTETLSDLFGNMGPVRGEEALCRAMEELAARLAEAERAFQRDDWSMVLGAVMRVTVIARQIGMVGLVRIARDCRACLEVGDAVALAATLGRLMRVGERSLMALWDQSDRRR